MDLTWEYSGEKREAQYLGETFVKIAVYNIFKNSKNL